jgi:23S rRNA pseudouridine2605 synthase
MILIEGRNREIRKMFEEVGHHVEKIRRVGYGPLVLDLEPGLSRELTPEEIAAVRRAAQGKSARSTTRAAAPKRPRPASRGFRRPATGGSSRPARRKPARRPPVP